MKSHSSVHNVLVLLFALILLMLSSHASADIVDDIRLKTDKNGEIDAVVKLTVPIQYLRHFPQQKSNYVGIYFNILGSVAPDEWQNYESHRSPPSDLIVGFTVSTRDLTTGPKVDVQFNRAAEFSVSLGKDGRSLLIHIKPETPAPAQASASSPITLKDGLPVFPTIEKVTLAGVENKPSEILTSDEALKRANTQAAVLMAQARDLLFAGQIFGAISPFNEVLKLPVNKYSQDAQLWVGIAREKSGQIAKAKLEYESYLKFYPDGIAANWVKARLAKLNAILISTAAANKPQPVKAPSTDFQFTQYGSLSSYYYYGESKTDSITSAGSTQVPTSITRKDQSALIGNVSTTARAYNNEFDNRLVFQDLYAKDFLPTGLNRNRLNAAYFEMKNRVDNYSARIGRQSAMGGGVLGRFDGLTVGYGFMPGWKANLVGGQLSDVVIGTAPKFVGGSLDFGTQSSFGGTVYVIKQSMSEFVDRSAVGGNLRYFEARKMVMAMVDYDLQFRELNMATIQGTINGESGTDFNMLLDRRRTTSLSISSSVNGTAASVDALIQNGWTIDDLIALARLRSAYSNMAQLGMTNHLTGNWQIGTDVVVSNSSAIDASGTLNPDGTTGLEGFVGASPATGNAWTISERIIGNAVFSSRDVSMCTLSYSKSNSVQGKTLMLNSRLFAGDVWMFDETLRQYWQTDNTGGSQVTTSPMTKVSYRIKNTLSLEAEAGIDFTQGVVDPLNSSKTTRKYISMGFRWDF
jgi:tetratricopeptide (TPR) repeat protein